MTTTSEEVTWVFDSQMTSVALPSRPLKFRGRAFITNLRTAVVYVRMNEDPVARLEEASVAPSDKGWIISGTNPAGEAEQWEVDAAPANARPCGCGKRS